MTRKERLEARNSEIRKEFDKMVNKQRLQSDFAYEELGKKHTLDAYTIYLIVKQIGAYADDNPLNV